MRATVSAAVSIAFKSLKDLAVPAKVTLRSATYDWSAGATEGGVSVPCEAVFVTDTVQNGDVKQYAIIKFEGIILAFSRINAGGKWYKCGDPVTSHKFVVMVDVYEIQ